MSDTALSKPDKELALRDYQRDLLTRTQSAQQSNSFSQKHLAFSAGGYRWLIQMEDAIEIMPIPSVMAVPCTYDWFRGLMNYRGRLVSVIDFNRLLAGPEAPKNKNDRLIVLSDRLSVPCALQVAHLSGLLDLNFSQTKSSARGDGDHMIPPVDAQGVHVDDGVFPDLGINEAAEKIGEKALKCAFSTERVIMMNGDRKLFA